MNKIREERLHIQIKKLREKRIELDNERRLLEKRIEALEELYLTSIGVLEKVIENKCPECNTVIEIKGE